MEMSCRCLNRFLSEFLRFALKIRETKKFAESETFMNQNANSLFYYRDTLDNEGTDSCECLESPNAAKMMEEHEQIAAHTIETDC